MKFLPIKPQKISDAIVIYLEDLILNGVLKPGDKLPAERELAKSLQVSRTSLRDALVKLVVRGLLQTHHNGGTFVRDIIGPTLTDQLVVILGENPDAMLDLLEVREALERVAAYYAAERATEPDRQVLVQHFARLNQFTETGDPEKDANVIVDYYLAMAEASHNIALMHVMRGLYKLMSGMVSESLQVIYQYPGTYESVYRYRRQMHYAIIHGNADAAAMAANKVTLLLRRTVREFLVNKHSGSELQTSRLNSAVKQRASKPVKHSDGLLVCNVAKPDIHNPLINLLSSNTAAVFDFLHLRESLEALCAAFAAERRNEVDLRQLQSYFIHIEQGVKTPDPYQDAGRITNFHIALAEASHNIVLVHIMRGLYELLRASVRTNLERIQSNSGKYKLVLKHHRQILKAVENQQADAAAQAASVHINFINQSISQFGVEQKRLEQSRRRAALL